MLLISRPSIYLLYKQKPSNSGLSNNRIKSWFAVAHTTYPYLLAEYLREKMGGSKIPIVLGGDFNEWQFMTKAFKDIHQVLNETPVRATFPVAWPLFRLDRMWTSFDLKRREEQHANISSISASVLKTPETRQFSDHYPILLDIAPRQQRVT